MPKTAMHKYCHLTTRQDNVRATRKSSVVETKPQPHCMQIPSHPHFGLSVAAPNGAHHPGPYIRTDRVNQVQLLLGLFVARHSEPIIGPSSIPAKTHTKPERVRSEATIDDDPCN